MTSQVYSVAGTGLWLCPAGVYSVQVQCWGGGGAGDFSTQVIGGDGGGGGEFSQDTVAVTPGKTYPWTVGNGGFTRGAQFGGPSSFSGDTLEVLANGGQGGSGTGKGGTGSVNSTHFSGGNGGTSGSHIGGSGGGSSGGTGAPGGNGGNGTNSAPGAGGTPPAGAGAGGAGAVLGSPGNPGSSPGGGGGGATAGAFIPGGRGAPGQVILTWTAPAQPVIPVFPAGYPALPADFDGWIQDPANFFTSGKPVFRAFLSGGATIPAGLNLLAFDNITEDPYNGWIGGTVNAWQAPAGYSGIYAVTLNVAATAIGGVIAARVGVNNASQLYAVNKAWIPGAIPGMASGAIPVTLFGGLDSVQGFAYIQPNAGVLSSSTGQQCAMTITWYSE